MSNEHDTEMQAQAIALDDLPLELDRAELVRGGDGTPPRDVSTGQASGRRQWSAITYTG